MTGVEGSVHTADNTQELAELFDATLKFTSVLKKKGVSQSNLTVRTALTQRERATFISSKVAAAKSVLKSPAGSSAMPTTDAQGEELWMPPDNTPSRRQGRSCSSPVKDSLLNSRQTHIDSFLQSFCNVLAVKPIIPAFCRRATTDPPCRVYVAIMRWQN